MKSPACSSQYWTPGGLTAHSVKCWLAFSLLSIAGCAQTPVTVVERVNVPTFLPVPATLTVPIAVDLSNATWGSAVGNLSAGLKACDAQLQAISILKAPEPSPPPL